MKTAIGPAPDGSSFKNDAPIVAIAKFVKMASHFGYWTEEGVLRSWFEGQIVTDKADIADLIGRKAPIVEV
jgi:hypothetical protein